MLWQAPPPLLLLLFPLVLLPLPLLPLAWVPEVWEEGEGGSVLRVWTRSKKEGRGGGEGRGKARTARRHKSRRAQLHPTLFIFLGASLASSLLGLHISQGQIKTKKAGDLPVVLLIR